MAASGASPHPHWLHIEPKMSLPQVDLRATMRAHLSPDIFIFEAISVISKSSVRKPSRVGMMLAGWNEPHVITPEEVCPKPPVPQ